jgi:hypothetical protein
VEGALESDEHAGREAGVDEGPAVWEAFFALSHYRRRRVMGALLRGSEAPDPTAAAVTAGLARWWLREPWYPVWAKRGWAPGVRELLVVVLVLLVVVPVAASIRDWRIVLAFDLLVVCGLYALQTAIFLLFRGRLRRAERINVEASAGE